jgi:hypothetical protein
VRAMKDTAGPSSSLYRLHTRQQQQQLLPHHQHQPVHATHGCCFCCVLSTAADTQRKTKEGEDMGVQRFACRGPPSDG